jgi:hypothetical protein
VTPGERRLREAVEQEDERPIVGPVGTRVEDEVADRELQPHDANAIEERLHAA